MQIPAFHISCQWWLEVTANMPQTFQSNPIRQIFPDLFWITKKLNTVWWAYNALCDIDISLTKARSLLSLSLKNHRANGPNTLILLS